MPQADSVLSFVQGVSAVAVQACGLTHIPILSFAASIFKTTIDQVQFIQGQKEQALAIVDLIAMVLLSVNKKLSSLKEFGLEVPEVMLENINRLEQTLMEVQEEFNNLTQKNFWRRLLKKDRMASVLTRHQHSVVVYLQIFQLEAEIDATTWADRDRKARQADAQNMNELLMKIASNQQALADLIQKDARGAPDLGEVKEVMHLTSRLGRAAPPGSVEAKFYKAAHRKMVSLSGRGDEETRLWMISYLEVDIEEEIGSGGFSRVHKGKWNGEEIAVKVLTEGTSEKALMKEAETWSRLDHPRIHRFYRACANPNRPILVSAYYPNGDALNYLSKHPDANRAEVMRGIASGMKYLHSESVLHGDLKALNVLIDDRGGACISDFGMAFIKMESSRTTAVRQNEKAEGTLRWMAPERLDNGGLTREVDVYAYAMTCFEIMTDEVPFGFINENQIVRTVREGMRPKRPKNSLPDLTNEVWELMERCWAQNPESRPDFASILEDCDEICRRNRASTTASVPSHNPPSTQVDSAKTNPSSNTRWSLPAQSPVTPTASFSILTPSPAVATEPTPIEVWDVAAGNQFIGQADGAEELERKRKEMEARDHEMALSLSRLDLANTASRGPSPSPSSPPTFTSQTSPSVNEPYFGE
ncbi:kinase-like domain-containing protein [Cantharellus anzutake]|uniref:kinase-like domain-containing protein n=1 Tax=Cantharellus anzutake TaxID=1750568 RepID=UPI0019034B3D|nr:kinase-like domain-containing protein [Cantharellus anzutake]KAF8338280.1 kinase-like domain-containing protein [Cantharellus anzutake]